jgi:hypothetical protein
LCNNCGFKEQYNAHYNGEYSADKHSARGYILCYARKAVIALGFKVNKRFNRRINRLSKKDHADSQEQDKVLRS